VTLQGRVALITGGSRGIGAAIAGILGAAGARVIVTYASSEAEAGALVSDLRSKEVEAEMIRSDIAVDPGVAVDAAIAAFGRLDIVVSNAGIKSDGEPVLSTSRDMLEHQLAIHAVGPHQLVRAALPHLRRHERSDVVFISSAATKTFRPGAAPYAMGKAAVEALARTLAREERQNGVRVNVVAPGIIDTVMGRDRLSQLGWTDAEALKDAPFGRVGTADDVARVVEFLVGEGGSYVTGQLIFVDGGGFAGTWLPRVDREMDGPTG